MVRMIDKEKNEEDEKQLIQFPYWMYLMELVIILTMVVLLTIHTYLVVYPVFVEKLKYMEIRL